MSPTLEAPFWGKRQRPVIPATLRVGTTKPVATGCLLDTGSDLTIVPPGTWRQWRRHPRPIGPPKPIGGIGGTTEAIPVGPATATLRTREGTFSFTLPAIWLAKDESVTYTLLGSDFYRQVKAVLTFDYPQSKATLVFEAGS